MGELINDSRILLVVPARGGSKGIPMKNLRMIGGRSLIARVGDVLHGLPQIDAGVVSTDHEDIAKEAEVSGIHAPFRRPDSLSGDRVGDLEVLSHALETMEMIENRTFDIIVMLQPTSPFRTGKQVTDCIEMLVNGGWDAVWTVSITDTKAHPLKQLNISDDQVLQLYDSSGERIIARQELNAVYHRNGVAYAFTRECILNQKTIMGKRTGAMIVEEPCVNIDTEWDIDYAEYLIQSGKMDA